MFILLFLFPSLDSKDEGWKRCIHINYHSSRTSPLKVNRSNDTQPVYHTTLTFITTNVPFLLCHSRETGAHSRFRGCSRPGNDARQLLHCVACHGFDKRGVGAVFAPSRLWLGETTQLLRKPRVTSFEDKVDLGQATRFLYESMGLLWSRC